MPLSPEEKREIMSRCTKFLAYHYPKSVEQQLREIAVSPYAQLPKDHYGKGGFVSELEAELAELLGKEAAVFMPSGTMAQQIALRIWCDRLGNNRVAFHPTCHLEIHEQGAYKELHHLQAILLGGKQSLFTLDDLQAIQDEIAVLLIELPQREIGGQLPEWVDLQDMCTWAKEHGVRLHLDGARLWECAPYYGRSYKEIVTPFDSVYVSFYKILGGLPGAALAGPADFIEEAKIWQRRHGGNLYQLSPNAISAKLGMEKHLPLIGDYVAKAKELAETLKAIEGVRVVPSDPPTNMMHVYISGDKEQMEERAWRLAAENKTFLFGALTDTQTPNEFKLELTCGEASLDWTGSEVKTAFEQIVGSSVAVG